MARAEAWLEIAGRAARCLGPWRRALRQRNHERTGSRIELDVEKQGRPPSGQQNNTDTGVTHSPCERCQGRGREAAGDSPAATAVFVSLAPLRRRMAVTLSHAAAKVAGSDASPGLPLAGLRP